MLKVMYGSDDSYVSCRAGVYYYIRRVPYDVRQHYASKRLSFSLKTKSYAGALRAAQSVTQRLEDYWLVTRINLRIDPSFSSGQHEFPCTYACNKPFGFRCLSHPLVCSVRLLCVQDRRYKGQFYLPPSMLSSSRHFGLV